MWVSVGVTAAEGFVDLEGFDEAVVRNRVGVDYWGWDLVWCGPHCMVGAVFLVVGILGLTLTLVRRGTDCT